MTHGRLVTAQPLLIAHVSMTAVHPLYVLYEVGSVKSKVGSKVGSDECRCALRVRCARQWHTTEIPRYGCVHPAWNDVGADSACPVRDNEDLP